MQGFADTLAALPILTLFVVIGLGYVLGSIRIFGFQFGVAGVLFVGIAVGALDPRIALPEVVASLGLIIFVYTIGIQSGPGFFASFRKQGARDNLLAMAVLVFAAALTFALGHALHLGGPRTAGLFCGALTNTPALAAARERILEQARLQQVPLEQARLAADQPVVAYSLAYPIGVIGVLLCLQLMKRIWRVQASAAEPSPLIRSLDFRIKNPGIAGRTIGEILQVHKDLGFVISRVRHGNQAELASSGITLHLDDIVVVVGDEVALSRAEQLFGEPAQEQIEFERSDLALRRYFVSDSRVVGRRIGDLDLHQRLGATITRLRRGDVDLVPTPETRLEFGDLVRVLARKEQLAGAAQFFGNSIRGTAETDFGSVAIGMVLGVLVGMLPIPLPGGSVIRLGLAGGPLLVALLLGFVERTGRITWTIPTSANLTLRQVGLLLFLAAVGTRAGFTFLQTIRHSGWEMIFAGAVITFTVTLVTLVVGYKWLKIPFDSLSGLASGIQTQPAALAFANNSVLNDRPNLAYATVYPLSMILKIILAQLLV